MYGKRGAHARSGQEHRSPLSSIHRGASELEQLHGRGAWHVMSQIFHYVSRAATRADAEETG
jgi:hypothetical protein